MDRPLRAGLDEARAALKPDERAPVQMTHGSMRLLFYAPVGTDTQTPHKRDELYVVVSGSGTFVCDGTRTPFRPGDVLFAAAGAEHRFDAFTSDFGAWVVFYGPEGGEARSTTT